MFSLIFGFYNMAFSKPDVHLLIVGLDHAGKSTLLEHIKGRYSRQKGLPPDQITPTIGMNLAKFKHKGTQVVLWDLGGQPKMRTLWERYYSEANTVVFVVDSTDTGRFQEAYAAFREVTSSPLLRNVPMVILANKQDLSGAATLADIAKVFLPQAHLVAHQQQRLFGISALTGQGVHEALETACTEAKRYVQQASVEMADTDF